MLGGVGAAGRNARGYPIYPTFVAYANPSAYAFTARAYIAAQNHQNSFRVYRLGTSYEPSILLLIIPVKRLLPLPLLVFLIFFP